MIVSPSTILFMEDTRAIPIPPKRVQDATTRTGTTATTPSLQSVLHQRKFSHMSLKEHSISSQDTAGTPESCASSLLSVLSAEMESCDSHPLECPVSYMDDIDEDFFNTTTTVELLAPMSPPTMHKVASFVSNLTRSFRSLANSTTMVAHQNNELLFNELQPRLTDDKVPSHWHELLPQVDTQSTELETYKVTSQPSHSSSHVTVHRARESRINSQFLRLYAHEASARHGRLLPEISHTEESRYLEDPSLYEGTEHEFALLVRQRLWQCVVLPPREDALCDHAPEYVRVPGHDGNEHDATMTSRLATQQQQLKKPWVTFEDERKGELGPRGVLGKGTQFVVKGWCNARWLPTEL